MANVHIIRLNEVTNDVHISPDCCLPSTEAYQWYYQVTIGRMMIKLRSLRFRNV